MGAFSLESKIVADETGCNACCWVEQGQNVEEQS
jgi:hypothetical protein